MTQLKEEEALCTKESLLVIKSADGELKTSDLHKNVMNDDTLSNYNPVLDEHMALPNSENIEITVWKRRKIHLNKSLIPLRIALFLWFASDYICLPFFSLMLTQKGLTLTDFSPVFSMIFLLQFLVAYICGIIADKLGDSKPVLLFLMLGTICVITGLILSPDLTDKPPLEHHSNVTCSYSLNCGTVDLKYCENICTANNTDYFTIEAENNKNNSLITSFKEFDDLNNNRTIEDIFYSNEMFNSCYEVCSSCLDDFEKNCVSTSKVGFKVLYSVLILSFFSLWSTTYRFLDFASLNLAKENNSHLGNERFYGYLGAFTATLLCNFALNIDKSGKSYYINVFWLAVALFVMAVISACNIRNVILPPGLNLSKKTLKLFTDIEIVSLILIAFVAGTGYTFTNFFSLLFLDSLNASKTVIGFHIMASALYSMPVYLTSKWWLKKLRRTTIVTISFLSYAISGISYSFLYFPWISIIIEITSAFSFHMFWVSTVIYCNEVAPEGFVATLNAVVGTFHFGIGRSVSVPVGGYFMSTFGARTAFRILAGFFLFSAILYLALIYLRYLISKSSSEKRSKDPEEMKRMNENEA